MYFADSQIGLVDSRIELETAFNTGIINSFSTGDTIIELQLLVQLFLANHKSSVHNHYIEYSYDTHVLVVIKYDRGNCCSVGASLCCFQH